MLEVFRERFRDGQRIGRRLVNRAAQFVGGEDRNRKIVAETVGDRDFCVALKVSLK